MDRRRLFLAAAGVATFAGLWLRRARRRRLDRQWEEEISQAVREGRAAGAT